MTIFATAQAMSLKDAAALAAFSYNPSQAAATTPVDPPIITGAQIGSIFGSSIGQALVGGNVPGALLGPIGGAIDASVNENAGAFQLTVVSGTAGQPSAVVVPSAKVAKGRTGL